MRSITAGFISAQRVSDVATMPEMLIELHAQIKLQRAPSIKPGISSAIYISSPYNLLSLPTLWAPPVGPDSLQLPVCLCFQI